jgi:DNA-binding protein YbaB
MTDPEYARWAAAVATESEKYQRVSRRVTEAVVHESSRDGLVKVTVGASGVLRDLEISDQARGVSGATLAASIMTTLHRAQSRIADAVSEIVTEIGMDAPGDAEALVSSYRRRFPEPAPDTPPRRRPARDHAQDDEDWDGPAVTE